MPQDEARMEQAILFLESHFRDQPTLEQAAARAGLSPFHFQRLFRRWVGISPKRFTQYLTAEYAESLLRQSRNALETAYEAGLSSAGRLHDLFINIHAVTPGEMKGLGAGLTIRFGVHPTPFGPGLFSMTERGLCGLAFIAPEEKGEAVAALRRRWPRAALRREPSAVRPIAERIFAASREGAPLPIDLHIRGTNFQIRVWEALLQIPPGAVVRYEEIARSIGAPTAARAVGTAVGQNPVAFLIPCHRVIRKSGAIGPYRWGAERKKAILAWESARLPREENEDRTASRRSR